MIFCKIDPLSLPLLASIVTIHLPLTILDSVPIVELTDFVGDRWGCVRVREVEGINRTNEWNDVATARVHVVVSD